MHGGSCVYIIRCELDKVNRLSKNLNRVFVSGERNGTRPNSLKSATKLSLYFAGVTLIQSVSVRALFARHTRSELSFKEQVLNDGC